MSARASVTAVAAVISCEHAGNDVPPEYAALFADHRNRLASHRGYDPGSAELAAAIAKHLGVTAHTTFVSRLLVEANRSLHHRRLFSDITASLPADEKQRILARWYHPYREAVAAEIRRHLDHSALVVHVLVHTFTPVLDGHTRNADVALLYDPARPRERDFATRWRAAILAADPAVRVRRNYPYRGTSDGFEVFLRRQHPGPNSGYLGITLEANQAMVTGPSDRWATVCHTLAETLTSTIAAFRDDATNRAPRET